LRHCNWSQGRIFPSFVACCHQVETWKFLELLMLAAILLRWAASAVGLGLCDAGFGKIPRLVGEGVWGILFPSPVQSCCLRRSMLSALATTPHTNGGALLRFSRANPRRTDRPCMSGSKEARKERSVVLASQFGRRPTVGRQHGGRGNAKQDLTTHPASLGDTSSSPDRDRQVHAQPGRRTLSVFPSPSSRGSFLGLTSTETRSATSPLIRTY
jgi:hypothetical protein